MYLVDTSVWIDYLRGKSNQAVRFLKVILDEHLPFGISSVIYQEILQGAAKDKDFQELNKYLSTQTFYHLKDPIKSYYATAKMYYQCRRKGITVRSTIDCLIAQIAIENKLYLLHNDKDFNQLKKVVTSLKFVEP